jgi:hypothetical protein
LTHVSNLIPEITELLDAFVDRVVAVLGADLDAVDIEWILLVNSEMTLARCLVHLIN